MIVKFINFWRDKSYWDEKSIFFKIIRRSINKNISLLVDNNSKNPDIVISSIFIRENIDNYKNCVKIFYTGENPKKFLENNVFNYYNKFDLVLSYETTLPNNLKCKHIRLPNWMILSLFDKVVNLFDFEYDNITKIEFYKLLYKHYELKKNNKAILICRHDNGGIRNKIVKYVSKYIPVDCAGRWNNNVTMCKPGWIDKINYIKKYSYNICPENSIYPGYNTEKLFEALISGCIPIYWGDSIEDKYFNKEKIILTEEQLNKSLKNIEHYKNLKPFTDNFYELIINKKDEIIRTIGLLFK